MSNLLQSVLLPWLQAFTAALVPGLFGLGLVWLRQHNMNTTVVEAVGRAAGEAYKQMAQSGLKLDSAAGLNGAVAAGKDYLLARIPQTLAAAGVTPEGAAQMVSAELGKLLAADPTVSVAAGSMPRTDG